MFIKRNNAITLSNNNKDILKKLQKIKMFKFHKNNIKHQYNHSQKK